MTDSASSHSVSAAPVLSRLLADTAGRLQALTDERALAWVNERDHLARCFRDALEDGLAETGYRAANAGERKCHFPEHFPRVGDVDALLARDGEAPVWVELKCGSDRHSLSACGYDAIKSAVGLRCGAASDAYLLAGAPEKLWRQQLLGTNLFEAQTWRAEDLRTTFEAPFREYEELADPRPMRVPDRIATAPIGRPARFVIGGTAWELRLAQVAVNDGSWYDWPPFLTSEAQTFASERRRQR